MGYFVLISKIISDDYSKNTIHHSWCDLRLSFTEFMLGIVLDKCYYSNGISTN